MSPQVSLGLAHPIPILDLLDESYDQDVQRLTQSPEGQRDSRQGIIPAVYATFHTGGLRPKIQLGSWQRDLDKYGFNQGLQSHIPFGLYPPYLLQVQSQITSGEDMSGFRAANHRAHPLNSNLGGSAYRYLVAIGEALYRDVSTSDHSLEYVTTSGLTAADYVGFGCLNEVWDPQGAERRVYIGKKNVTANPYEYTTDITAGTVAFTNAGYVSDAGQYALGIDSLPQVTGFVFLYGRLSDGANKDGLFCSSDMRAFGTGNLTHLIDIPVGGYSIGESPWTSNRVGYVVPLKDELTTVAINRRVLYADYTSVPAVTVSYENVDMAHVEHACWYVGGLAAIGGNQPGPARRAVLVDSGGVARDLQFPGLNGTTEYRAISLTPTGRILRVLVSKTDGTDGQTWLFDLSTGAWHASCPLLTLADTPGGIPIGTGRPETNINQAREYIFTPDGADTTKTNVYRQFVPEDYFANPLLSNTTEKFHFGSVVMRGLQLDTFGPTEANKALTRIIYGSRYLSTTSGSYGPLTFSVAVDGNIGTFTAVESNAFDTAFEVYNVPARGRAFKTLLPQWSWTNGSTTEGNAETSGANMLPLVIEGVAKHPDVSRITLVLDMPKLLANYGSTGLRGFVAALRTLEDVSTDLATGKPVMRFRCDDPSIGIYDMPVTLESRKLGTKQSVLVLQEVRGATT